MTQSERIEGKVAQILNDRELVLNVGTVDGVKEQMRFAVLNRRGAQIKDPDSGEVLGSVELPKVLLQAVRVQPRLTVARTFRTRARNLGGAIALPLRLFEPPRWVDVPETLKLGEKPNVAELSDEDSYVKVGDPVVEVLGDEFDVLG